MILKSESSQFLTDQQKNELYDVCYKHICQSKHGLNNWYFIQDLDKVLRKYNYTSIVRNSWGTETSIKFIVENEDEWEFFHFNMRKEKLKEIFE